MVLLETDVPLYEKVIENKRFTVIVNEVYAGATLVIGGEDQVLCQERCGIKNQELYTIIDGLMRVETLIDFFRWIDHTAFYGDVLESVANINKMYDDDEIRKMITRN